MLQTLSRAMNANNYQKISEAAVSIFEPLEPWAAAVIKTPEEALRWSYCVEQSLCLLLEPLLPAILADLPIDKVEEVQYSLDAAKRHIAGIDKLQTIRENAARKMGRSESLVRKASRWLGGKKKRLSKREV